MSSPSAEATGLAGDCGAAWVCFWLGRGAGPTAGAVDAAGAADSGAFAFRHRLLDYSRRLSTVLPFLGIVFHSVRRMPRIWPASRPASSSRMAPSGFIFSSVHATSCPLPLAAPPRADRCTEADAPL